MDSGNPYHSPTAPNTMPVMRTGRDTCRPAYRAPIPANAMTSRLRRRDCCHHAHLAGAFMRSARPSAQTRSPAYTRNAPSAEAIRSISETGTSRRRATEKINADATMPTCHPEWVTSLDERHGTRSHMCSAGTHGNHLIDIDARCKFFGIHADTLIASCID